MNEDSKNDDELVEVSYPYICFGERTPIILKTMEPRRIEPKRKNRPANQSYRQSSSSSNSSSRSSDNTDYLTEYIVAAELSNHQHDCTSHDSSSYYSHDSSCDSSYD